MKTKIILPFACTLFFLSITNLAFPQVTAKNYEINKTLGISAGDESKDYSSGITSITINNKIQKHFSRDFAGASAQNWNIAGKNFHCSFFINGLPEWVLFSKNGQLIYNITFGTEKNMPTEIRKIVKAEYYDYTITQADQVKQDNRDIWIVNLKDSLTYKTVRIEDGVMELVQQFRKGH